MRTRITFDKVSLTGHKSVPCNGCAAPLKRQRQFWQTLNPFNVHELTKLPKDRAQIVRELREDIHAWQKVPELCRTCQARADEEEGQRGHMHR